MKLGIVGLPNVGKSTLFNSLTKAGAESANYPFCTIDPNVGVVAVPDDRLDKLAALYNSAKITPAVIEFVDIAGLVKGAKTTSPDALRILSTMSAAAVVAHRHHLVLDRNVDLAAGPHDKFIDRVVDDLLDEDVNAVVGLRAVAQLADIHAGAQTDMLPRRKRNDGVVAVAVVRIGIE